MSLAIVDYDVGNLRSVQKAFEALGYGAKIVRHPDELSGIDRVILPGVGAFGDAIAALRNRGWIEPLVEHIRRGRPFLGICLGLQMLFETSHEDGPHAGLAVVPGEVVSFVARPDRKVPHMGWNQLWWEGASPLTRGLQQGAYAYFVHSYHAVPRDTAVVAMQTDYGGERFCAAVSQDNLHAVQFHPEKSQAVGLTILTNFVGLN